MEKQYQALFEPIKIGCVEVKNRYVMSPMATFGLVDSDGILTDSGVEYYVARAKGGMGLIITGVCFVEDSVELITTKTMMCTNRTDHWREKQQFNKMAERIHAYGGKIFLQLGAGYGRSARIPSAAGRAMAPSPLPNRWDPTIIHQEMTTEEVERIVSAFGRAAAFAKECGIDALKFMLYMRATYWIIYNECFNHRTDKYGGSLKNVIGLP